MSEYYPAPAFRFAIYVAGRGTPLPPASPADGSFQEISGLEAQVDLEPLPQGGEDRVVHRLLGPTRAPTLVLRRGYVTAPSFLSEWVAQTVDSPVSQPLLTQTLVVMLLNENGSPAVAWAAYGAWPVRWTTGPFDSMKNEVLTEVLEFACSYTVRVPLNEALFMVGSVAALTAAGPSAGAAPAGKL
jgi:phage tail-like protein